MIGINLYICNAVMGTSKSRISIKILPLLNRYCEYFQYSNIFMSNLINTHTRLHTYKLLMYICYGLTGNVEY